VLDDGSSEQRVAFLSWVSQRHAVVCSGWMIRCEDRMITRRGKEMPERSAARGTVLWQRDRTLRSAQRQGSKPDWIYVILRGSRRRWLVAIVTLTPLIILPAAHLTIHWNDGRLITRRPPSADYGYLNRPLTVRDRAQSEMNAYARGPYGQLHPPISSRPWGGVPVSSAESTRCGCTR